MFHPWWANGRDQEWYDEKKDDLPEWQLAQEYPDNPDDAFLKSGRPVFSLEVLRKSAASSRDPIVEGYLAEHRQWQFVDERGGRCGSGSGRPTKVATPSGPTQPRAMDTATSPRAHVINARDGHVVATWHGRIDPDLFGSDVLAPLGRMYSQALIGVESNNHGLTTLKALHRAKYHPLYMQRSPRYKRSVPTDILGWRTTQITKPLAVDELNMALRERSVTLCDAETLAELRTFVRDDAGKMGGSPFDDRTISLSIANQMIKYVWLKQYEPEREPGPGTMGWFEKQLYGDDVLAKITPTQTSDEPEPIGSQWVRDPTESEGLMTEPTRHPASAVQGCTSAPNSRKYDRGYDTTPHEVWGDSDRRGRRRYSGDDRLCRDPRIVRSGRLRHPGDPGGDHELAASLAVAVDAVDDRSVRAVAGRWCRRAGVWNGSAWVGGAAP